jgi:hypothetical protein
MKAKTKRSANKVSLLQASNTESKYNNHQLFLHELEEEIDWSKLRKNRNQR